MLYNDELNAEMPGKCSRGFDPHAPELPGRRVLDAFAAETDRFGPSPRGFPPPRSATRGSAAC